MAEDLPIRHPRRLLPRALLVALVAGVLACHLLLPTTALTVQAKAVGLASAALVSWVTARLPEGLTALLFLLLAVLTATAPATVVFSGFTSTALWMVFAGFVIAAGLRRTGLDARGASFLSTRLQGGYVRQVAAMVGVGVALGFVLPSSLGRVALLVPLAMGVAREAGFEPGTNGYMGIVLAAAFGTHVPTFAILPANVPNLVWAGAIESLGGVTPLYGRYLLLHFPVLGLLKSVLLVWSIIRLFPDSPVAVRPRAMAPRVQPFAPGEKRLLLILTVTIALWLTDPLHQIAPAWIALATAVLLLWPGFGPVPFTEIDREVKLGALLFVAGILGVSAVLAHVGAGEQLAAHLIEVLPLSAGHPLLNYTTLVLTSLMTGLATTLPGVPAVLTPLAEQMASASGLPLEAVLMTQVVGFSTVLLPYQSPPLVIALHLAGVRIEPVARLTLLSGLLTVAILLPLDALWWRLLAVL